MKTTKLFTLALAATMASCSSGSKFKVEGSVSGAENKTIYLEASQLQGLFPLDSVKLNANGSFSFEYKRPESPEFYRLRIDNKTINFSIDSTETLQFKASYPNFSTDYTVEGSENASKIKDITLKQAKLQELVDTELSKVPKGLISNRVLQENLDKLFTDYKTDIRENYIFSAPNTTAAYFALFPKINGYMLFDPLNSKEDLRCYAAVATSLNEKYPHADRTKNIYNIVIKGMKNTRKPVVETLDVPTEKVSYTGIIDIELRDLQGNLKKLSELKGKVVLLDFTVYQNAMSASHIFALRDIYQKYNSQGLEIYQVSLDADEHFWRNAVDNLPWICVRDGQGIYSKYASTYNVQKIPSYFVINKANELVGRSENIEDLEKLLKPLF